MTNGGHAGQDTNVDDSWVADGSYLRVNLIQLGYTFNADVLKRMGLSRLRIYANANNPFLFTSKDFKGYDPESTSQYDPEYTSQFTSQGNGKFGQNMTFFSYPRAKTFSLCVNVTF
ncbi:hypothetical protein D3C79_858920 [compost metagenome]